MTEADARTPYQDSHGREREETVLSRFSCGTYLLPRLRACLVPSHGLPCTAAAPYLW